MSDQVKQIDDERIEVTGPAIVRTDGDGDYELTTHLKLKFSGGSEVWVKAWPDGISDHDQLLKLMAEEGARRCGYATDAESWINGRCDCKWITLDGRGHSEETGCCEIRDAYNVISDAKVSLYGQAHS